MKRAVMLDDAAEEYLAHCQARGLARLTVVSRRSALGQLLETTGNIQTWRLEGRHFDRVFAAYPWAQSTRNNRLAQYENFVAWCRARGYMSRDSDPLFGWNRKAPAEALRTRIPRAEWSRLFDACQTPRESVVVATGLYLFLRASEQQAIRIKNIDLAECEIDIYRTKTGQWDRMPIPSELDPYLREHLAWYSARISMDPEFFLIPAGTRPKDRNSSGQLLAGSGHLNPRAPFSKPHKVVQAILGRCGYPTAGEGEHTLRRSGARAYFDHLVESGYDGALRRVQSMLGHKDSKMTEVYLGLDLDRRTRNEDLRGRPMFPPVDTKTVVRLEDYRGEA